MWFSLRTVLGEASRWRLELKTWSWEMGMALSVGSDSKKRPELGIMEKFLSSRPEIFLAWVLTERVTVTG